MDFSKLPGYAFYTQPFLSQNTFPLHQPWTHCNRATDEANRDTLSSQEPSSNPPPPVKQSRDDSSNFNIGSYHAQRMFFSAPITPDKKHKIQDDSCNSSELLSQSNHSLTTTDISTYKISCSPASSISTSPEQPDLKNSSQDDSGNSSDTSSHSNAGLDSPESSTYWLSSSPASSLNSSPDQPIGTSQSPYLTNIKQSGLKKNTRTNYSPQQVRCLERIYTETPYPDSDMMERLSQDLSIPEKNIKIWFQNKRARCRKRVQNNKTIYPPTYPCYPAPMPPVAAYNMMSPSSLMSSHAATGYNSVQSTVATSLINKSKSPPLHPLQFPSYTTYTYPYMFPAV